MAREIEALRTVRALTNSGEIATAEPPREIAAAVAAGTIVIVKGAFDPADLYRIRAAVLAWDAPAGKVDTSVGASSGRYRGESSSGTFNHLFEHVFFALDKPDDAMGAAARASFERLAAYWRSLTGTVRGFSRGDDGKAIHPGINYYPVGGGYVNWHAHPLEPTRIGLLVNMSRPGVDFSSGGVTEFKTPRGIVDTMSTFDIGDICLFRYDLSHRVTPTDPGCEQRWDGRGRWTMLMPVRDRKLAARNRDA